VGSGLRVQHGLAEPVYRQDADGEERRGDVVLAVEDTFHATRYLDFVTGISYDRNEA
jgi:hypothetical protein